ncbi:MAG: LysR family transcriptional regulator [Firmicutes bacterium]|nr:LysR family transcriptional regulator [Bacillota bacterium]
MLDITQLRYIVEVEKAGSISKAAANLYVSQPYISKLIRDVENAYGVVLFTRAKSGMQATPEGEEFIYYAKSVLNQYDQLLLSVSPQSGFTNTLKLSVMRSSHVFEAFIEFIKQGEDKTAFSPEKRFRIAYLEGSMMSVLEDVANKNADVGLLGCSNSNFRSLCTMAQRRNVTIKEISRQKPYVVVSEDHPLARRGGPVKISELYNYGTVVYGDKDYGLSPDGSIRTGSFVDMEKLPLVITVYDRGTQMGLLSFTDCFIFGICSFDNQESMYRVVSLPIDAEGNKTIEDYCSIFAIATLSSKRPSAAAKDFITCAEKYFARHSDAE